MGRNLNPKEKAKIIHKRLKSCGYDAELFKERFSPDKKDFKEYEKFIDELNLYNKFFGYIMRIEV